MPIGFFSMLVGTMLRTSTPLASYSLMIPPGNGTMTLATYQWSVCGTRTIDDGVSAPGVGKTALVGGVVTRWSALGQSAGLDGNGGEYFGTFSPPVSGPSMLPASSIAGMPACDRLF